MSDNGLSPARQKVGMGLQALMRIERRSDYGSIPVLAVFRDESLLQFCLDPFNSSTIPVHLKLLVWRRRLWQHDRYRKHEPETVIPTLTPTCSRRNCYYTGIFAPTGRAMPKISRPIVFADQFENRHPIDGRRDRMRYAPCQALTANNLWTASANSLMRT